MIQLQNDKDIVKYLETNEHVICYFTADWCGPCKAIKPKITGLPEKNPNIKFIEINIDKYEKLSNICNIVSVPTFMFFTNGIERTRFSGVNYNQLINEITKCNELKNDNTNNKNNTDNTDNNKLSNKNI